MLMGRQVEVAAQTKSVARVMGVAVHRGEPGGPRRVPGRAPPAGTGE